MPRVYIYVGSKRAKGGIRRYEYIIRGTKSHAIEEAKRLHSGRMIRGKIRTIKVKEKKLR